MENPKCPYCGGEMEYHWENNPMLPEGWFYCTKCHSQAPTAKTENEAYASAMRRDRAKGEWIVHIYKLGMDRYECSACHERNDREKNFCPNCGADMRQEGNGDE